MNKIKVLWQKRREHMIERDSETNKKGRGKGNRRGKAKVKLQDIMISLFDIVKNDEVPECEKEFAEDQRNCKKNDNWKYRREDHKE